MGNVITQLPFIVKMIFSTSVVIVLRQTIWSLGVEIWTKNMNHLQEKNSSLFVFLINTIISSLLSFYFNFNIFLFKGIEK